MSIKKRVISLLLVVTMFVLMAPVSVSANKAIGLDSVKALVNAEPLYPQITGYPELDNLIEGILKPYRSSDTYTQLKALYDWTVVNVRYSWAGYSQQKAPAYDKFNIDYNLAHNKYVKNAYPKDMINRAYHSLTARTGVCYDYAILFTVMARYIGIESYVRTGTLYVGATWSGHHGWSELKLGGRDYIFDPQQDNREKYDLGNSNLHKHFGIAVPASRWVKWSKENDLRDAQLLPVTVQQYYIGTVNAVSSLSGSVTGGGQKHLGDNVTLTPVSDKKVVGWYDPDGKLLSTDQEYTFLVTCNRTVYALFAGDKYIDIQNKWYTESSLWCSEQGYMTGTDKVKFSPDRVLTRAQFVQILAKINGVDLNAVEYKDRFTDVPDGEWYSAAVTWAAEYGITSGISEDAFSPNSCISRAELAVFLRTYARLSGINVENLADMSGYSDNDNVPEWAKVALAWAVEENLISGTSETTLAPREFATRAQTSIIVKNFCEKLASNTDVSDEAA